MGLSINPAYLPLVSPAVSRFTDQLASFRRPIQRCTPSKWVEDNLRLPPGKKESFPGPVSFTRAPFLREIIDCAAMPGVQEVVVVMPTRMGKTLALRCWWAYIVCEDPSPVILFDASISKGRSLVTDELHPLVEHNAALRDIKPKNRHHFTADKIIFPGATFRVYGGNSVSGAAGDTARVLLCNEVEKWKGEQKSEASMIELVRHRTESFAYDRKHYLSSTPSSEGGTIWKEHEKGDRRRWFVPCPCCSHMQQLVWEQVDFRPDLTRGDDGEYINELVLEHARYRCANAECGELLDDAQRLAAIQDPRSEWRPTAIPKIPGFRSYQVNGLYGSLPTNNIGDLAVGFLESGSAGMFADRKDWWNSRMGLPWKDTVATFDASVLRKRIEPYDRGTLPAGFRADLIIVGYDVQTYGFPWVVFAFNWAGECRTIDHGTAATFADLDAVQRDYAPLAPRSYVIGDINFEDRRAECAEAVFVRQDKGWLVADGQMHTRELVKQSTMNPFMGSAKGYQSANAAITRLIVSTYDFKLEWEKRFTGEIGSWHTYAVAADAEKTEHTEQSEYFSQLLAERRRPRKKKRPGLPEFEWYARSKENHAFDCHVYALALFWLLSRARTAAEKAASASASQSQAGAARRTATVTRR